MSLLISLPKHVEDDRHMADQTQSNDLLALTTDIVSSHVSNNTVEVGELPQLIQHVYSALAIAASVGVADARPKPKPAVAIKGSVKPSYIVCLEDGMKLKMLKRHLRTRHDMTPEEYRQRWGLPSDYPTVAPNYAKQRSELAKKIGLGTKRRRRRRR